MRAKVHGLAKAAGREKDVIEYGTSPSAQPVNIVGGMSAARFQESMTYMMDRAIQGKTNNYDFLYKSIQIATDAFQMLVRLAERDRRHVPTLALISELFADVRKASGLFAAFSKLPDLTEEQREFVKAVEGNRFHILNQTQEVLRYAGTTHHEQCSYYRQTIDTSLLEFLNAPGIKEKFCDQGGEPVSMGEIFDRKQIGIINFMPETGPVGARLARDLLEKA